MHWANWLSILFVIVAISVGTCRNVSCTRPNMMLCILTSSAGLSGIVNFTFSTPFQNLMDMRFPILNRKRQTDTAVGRLAAFGIGRALWNTFFHCIPLLVAYHYSRVWQRHQLSDVSLPGSEELILCFPTVKPMNPVEMMERQDRAVELFRSRYAFVN